MTDQLREDFTERVSLVIYLKSNKYVNKLKHYGYLQYVSRRMNYAIMYINQESQEKTIEKIEQEHFVDSVEISPKGSLDLTYDGLLEEMQREINVEDNADESSLYFY